MTVHVALSGTELGYLRGGAAPRFYLSVVNSTETATAQINMPSGITFPAATLTVDNTSAAWSSVAAGMTVAIGSAAGLSDYGLYRVRKAGDATTLHIGETSSGDLGLITRAIRNAAFGDNAYITVYLRRRDIHSVIPRIVMPAGSIFEDYDATESTEHSTPENIAQISFNSTDRRAGFVDAGQTYRTIQFDAVEALWPTAASVASRLWTAPAAWGAPTAGSTTTASVTYRVPQSAENYEIKYQFTDNNGIVTTAYRQVWAHARSGATAPIPVSAIGGVSWDQQFTRATISLADTGLNSIPTGAMVVLWCDATFAGQNVNSAITQWVGWVVRQTEITSPGLRGVELEIAGPTTILQKRGAYSQWFEKNANPDSWQELVTTLEYVDFLVWWVAWKRARGVTECFDWNKAGMSNLTARLPQWRVESSGNLYQQMQSLAESYSCNVGCNPDGSIHVRQHPNMVAYSARGAFATRAAFTATHYRDLRLEKAVFPEVRSVRGEGFFWNGASDLPTPLLSDAPGDAPGQGTRDERLQGQTVDSQAYLNTITGLAYARFNNPYPDYPLEFEGFWPALYPAELQFISHTTPANLRPDGAVLAVNAIPRSVSLRPVTDGDGRIISWDTTVNCEGETSGVAGVTVEVPTQATPDNPNLQPPTLTAPSVTVGSRDGGEVIGMTDTHLGYTVNARSGGTVNWTPIANPGGSLIDLQLDPFSPLFQVGRGAIRAYLLTTTGLYYCQDLLAGTAVWALKNSLGALTGGILRCPPIPGVVYVGWGNDSIAAPKLTHAQRLTNYGASSAWHLTFGTHFANFRKGMDCDQYGADELLIGYRSTATGAHLARILNGVATTIYSGVFDFDEPTMVQKPLKTLSGANNSSTGGAELIYFGKDETLMRSENGGTAWSTVVGWPTINNHVPSSISSIVFTDDSRVIQLPASNGNLHVSTDGATFTKVQSEPNTQVGLCGGFWPRQRAGQYVLYTGAEAQLCISDDFGTTLTDITGDWGSAVGTPGIFRDVVPLS